MSKLGDFRTEVGLAGMAVGTVFAGGVVKAVDAASDWEDAMADVKKVTDAETAEELSGGFQDLSEEIPIAASELATIGEQAGKFGAEGSEDIMSFVETVGKIQTATDLTAEEAGKRFAKIAGAVGMPLDEVGKLGNATNALADSMKTDANEITDTATRSANTLSQQLGLGEDAVLALSASMNEVSPSSRIAASSLKRAAESLMDPKKVDDVAGALGMTSDEFKTMRDEDPQGLMEKVAKAMEENGETADELRGILGKAATDFSKLGGRLDATAEAQDKANQQFEDGTSLQEEMEIRTNTFSGQMQMLKDRIRNVGITIGEQFLPYLTTLMGHVSGAIERFASLNEKTDGMLGAVTLAAGKTIGGGSLSVPSASVGGQSMASRASTRADSSRTPGSRCCTPVSKSFRRRTSDPAVVVTPSQYRGHHRGRRLPPGRQAWPGLRSQGVWCKAMRRSSSNSAAIFKFIQAIRGKFNQTGGTPNIVDIGALDRTPRIVIEEMTDATTGEDVAEDVRALLGGCADAFDTPGTLRRGRGRRRHERPRSTPRRPAVPFESRVARERLEGDLSSSELLDRCDDTAEKIEK